MRKHRTGLVIAAAACLTQNATAEIRELIDEADLAALAGEISGEAAKRNLDTISTFHRTRASAQYRAAAEHIYGELKAYGFSDARILEFPADGRTMFGTQKSRPAWDVKFAELWQLRRGENGEWVRDRKLGDWAAAPLTLAQDSLSGAAIAGLVDIGAGTSAHDFDGKDIAGKFVLTSSQPGAVADMAVGTYGAAGIISYAPNQRTAWWKEDERLVRWGHLSSFSETPAFAFMISLGEARRLQQRLADGQALRFDAVVDAFHDRKGHYAVVSATIPGADKSLRKQEIVFSCHLDHPRPGANDNASGCVAILEAARAAKKLIDEGRLARPKRTLRFLWPAEIEGTLMYLTTRPKDAARIKANIHMDMVGGNPETKAVFRISGGPGSLPHFISDLGHEVGRFVNTQSEIHASGGDTAFDLTAPEGDREALLAMMEGISLGSDHQIFNEGSWRIPGIYLHDWPDRYIHTNYDLPANIDPTKLKRSAFIGLATALFLADMDADDAPAVLAMLRRNALARAHTLEERRAHADAPTAAVLGRVHWMREHAKIDSIADFSALDEGALAGAHEFIDRLAALTGGADDKTAPKGGAVYARNPDIKGPMHAFGYAYIDDKLGARAGDLALPKFSAEDFNGREIDGSIYAYETLNLVDGVRSVDEIHAWLTATLAPIPREAVGEYLDALEAIDVVRLAQ